MSSCLTCFHSSGMLRSSLGALHCSLQHTFVAEDDLCFSFVGAGEGGEYPTEPQGFKSPSPYNSRGTSANLALFDTNFPHSETA